MNKIESYFRCAYDIFNTIPNRHTDYLKEIKEKYNFKPKVIYDIGSCLGQWTRESKKIWNESCYYLFEANQDVEFIYKEHNIENYHLGVLSDQDNKEITFYQSNSDPWLSSYYKPITTKNYYEKKLITYTVDTIVKTKNFPQPDLVKIDAQGSEIDILMGMQETLKSCQHLIVELQHNLINDNCPTNTQAIPIIQSLGFTLVTSLFSGTVSDGDYHFIKK